MLLSAQLIITVEYNIKKKIGFQNLVKDLTHESARKKEQNKQTELLGFEVSVQFSRSVLSEFLQPYDKQFYMINNNNKKTHKNRTFLKVSIHFFFFFFL